MQPRPSCQPGRPHHVPSPSGKEFAPWCWSASSATAPGPVCVSSRDIGDTREQSRWRLLPMRRASLRNASLPERATKFGIPCQSCDCAGDRFHGRRIKEKRRTARDFRQRRDRGARDRQPGAHGLDDREAETLEKRREHEELRSPVEIPQGSVIHAARHEDTRVAPRLDRGAVWRVADQDQRVGQGKAAAGVPERLHKTIDVLVAALARKRQEISPAKRVHMLDGSVIRVSTARTSLVEPQGRPTSTRRSSHQANEQVHLGKLRQRKDPARTPGGLRNKEAQRPPARWAHPVGQRLEVEVVNRDNRRHPGQRAQRIQANVGDDAVLADQSRQSRCSKR